MTARDSNAEDTHLMVDVETAGTSSGAAPLAIAAVRFTRKEIGAVFSQNVDLASAIAAGLTIDRSTLKWWSRKDGFERIRMNPCSLQAALHHLADFYDNPRSVWARGTDFDFGLVLCPAFDAIGEDPPWGYSNVRDVRTLCPERPENSTHNPVTDCKAQIQQLQRVWADMEGLYERTMPAQ